MHALDIIIKKRNGGTLSPEEIEYFIGGYVKGEIEEYQMSALLMAIYFNGMTDVETYNLTKTMLYSGDTINLDAIKGVKVDKHSTGGVGDKTTLVLGPILASLGIKFAKMSGRGLGHTGGTLDKLESIPGFNVNLDMDTFIDQVNDINISVIGQTSSLVPADKKLYSLRDVTGTVESIPLIASSIMSKKLAVSTDVISLDVKVGSGAFMKNLDTARKLAKLMVSIGKQFGRTVSATLTNMDEPLGCAIGNSLEVIEAINTLNGKGPKDFTELCLAFAGEILVGAKLAKTDEEGQKMALDAINSGRALSKLKELVRAQGGDVSYIDDPSKFALGKNVIEVKAETNGYVTHMDALGLGVASSHLGAGREKITDDVDHSTGIVVKKKVGDKISKGDTLAVIYSNFSDNESVIGEVKNSFVIGDEKVDSTLIYDLIR
ncbi:MAG: pyrimidine-nucleoside phosphorylase [Acholeplasmatales bacterium]|nr:pyrimidine-nucleoside phosphorylase [Acholeplasmatales bacterium]